MRSSRARHSKGSRATRGFLAPEIVCLLSIVALLSFHVGFLVGNNGRLLDSSSSSRRLQFLESFVNSTISSPNSSDKCSCSQKAELSSLGTEKKRKDDKSQSQKLFPDSMKFMLSGAARVDRQDFSKIANVGVRDLKHGNTDVLLLYTSRKSLPDAFNQRRQKEILPSFSTVEEAVQNCNVLKVILTNPGEAQHCIAIAGEYDSNVIYKFMRLPKDFVPTKKWNGPVITSLNYSLQLVGTSQRDNGNALVSPNRNYRDKNFVLLQDYLTKLPVTLKRLAPLAQKAAGKGNVVTVMVCNQGQSTLLFNFVCSAHAAGLDVSTVLLFATDEPTVELGQSLGLHVFDVQDAFGPLPVHAAQSYGDREFSLMMLAKVYCVQLVNHLKYDVLFQDADVVWQRNPLEHFENEVKSSDFDMFFQDDGSRSIRFSPYSANTGFYYVRHNQRTENFFSALVRSGDMVMEDGSHQSVLITLLREHASRHGLRIKVYGRDSDQGLLFPGGFHFHRRRDLMKDFMNGTKVPYVYHMSWTINHHTKRQFLQQMGYWYLDPDCVGDNQQPTPPNSTSTTYGTKQSLGKHCCISNPSPVCHYRDKPSRIPCVDSPNIDKKGRSFW